MATIVTRAGKGSALTWVEGDDNFTNLNTDKIEAVVDDTAPVLGGDLDVDEFKITTSSSTVPLTLEGYQDALYAFDIETNAETGTPPTINVNGQFRLGESTGVGYGAVTTQTGVGLFLGVEGIDLTKPNMNLDPGGAIVIQASGLTPQFEIISDGSLSIQGSTVSIQNLQYPVTDGTAGQVLTTDGSGVLSFQDPAGGGISAVVDDTAPQLGGNLDVNGNSIFANNGSVVLTAIETPIIGDDGTTSITLTHTGSIQVSGNLDVSAATIVSASNGNIVIAPNGTGATKTNNINYYEKIHSLGTTSGTITPDAANGNVQTITLNGNLTFSAFSNPVAGQSLTLIVNTGGTGRTLTSTMKFAGGEKTLSTANTTDIISVFYDGTNYWASLTRGYA